MFVQSFLKFIGFTLLSSISLSAITLSKSKLSLKDEFVSTNKAGLSIFSKNLTSICHPATLPSPLKPFIKKVVVNNLLKNQIKTCIFLEKPIAVNELNDFEIVFVASDINGIKSVTSSAMFDGWANISLLAPITVKGKTGDYGKFTTDLSITRSFKTPVKTYYYSKIKFIFLLEDSDGNLTRQTVDVDIN